jgi:hypothetical protein
MVDGAWLAGILEDTPTRIVAWRGQAAQLKHLVGSAEITGHVSDELLHATEQTCASIYAEIAKTAEVVQVVALTSLQAASQLAPLDDALHLVLLEVTELTTELYAVRSRVGKLSVTTLPRS